MEKVIERKGRSYAVDTAPVTDRGHKKTFAEIHEIRARPVSGVLANTFSEASDVAMFSLDRFYLSDDEKARVVLMLGLRFSRARAWKNLYDWARLKNKAQEGQECGA